MRVTPCPVPQDALLQRYVGQGATFTDCYTIEVTGAVTLAGFVHAFFSTALFRIERFVLGLALRKKISDADSTALLDGSGRFAVWTVEARATNELLLRDTSGHTRSWFAAHPCADGNTRLLFGSAVVAPEGAGLPIFARMTLPIHRIYARALLARAAADLNGR